MKMIHKSISFFCNYLSTSYFIKYLIEFSLAALKTDNTLSKYSGNLQIKSSMNLVSGRFSV